MSSLSSRPPSLRPSYPDAQASEVNGYLRPAPLTSHPIAAAAPKASTDGAAQLTNAFSQAPLFFRNLRVPTDQLRFELSLGVCVGAVFNSRIRQSDWFTLRSMCSRAPQDRPVETSTVIEHWFTDVGAMASQYGFIVPPAQHLAHSQPPSLCVLTDRSGQTVLGCQVRSICSLHIINGKALDYAAYDTRLVIRYEQDVSATLASQLASVPAGWRSRISRTRDRYMLSSARGWAIDLTLVRDDDAPNDIVYEAVVQLALPRDQMPVGPEQNLREEMGLMGKQAWNHLVMHMNSVGGRAREIGDAPVTELFVDCPQADDPTTRRLCALAAQAAGLHGASQRAFSAPLPVELTRDVWSNLGDVWIAEKTHGTRVLLLLSPEMGVHAMNLSGTCFALSGHPPWQAWALAVCARLHKGVVLDCELTANLAAGKSECTLLATSLMMDNGAPCNGLDFVMRSHRLREVCARIFDGVVGPEIQRPFIVRVKRFVSRQMLPALALRMEHWIEDTQPRERVIHYELDNFHFVVDGLLVVDARTQQLYEWRPAWKCTVDLFGDRQGNTDALRLSAYTDTSNLVRVATMRLASAQLAALSRIYIDSELQSRHIPRTKAQHPMAECRYCPDTKQWVLVRFRTDKTQPDYISRVIESMQALIRPLEFSELLGRK